MCQAGVQFVNRKSGRKKCKLNSKKQIETVVGGKELKGKDPGSSEGTRGNLASTSLKE